MVGRGMEAAAGGRSQHREQYLEEEEQEQEQVEEEEEERSIMAFGSVLEELDEEAREYCVGKQKKQKQKQKLKKLVKEKSKEEYVGPDTSSLTAFLLSLLSLSEPSGSYNDENVADGSDSEDEMTASSSGSKLLEVREGRHESEQQDWVTEEPGRLENSGKEDSPSTSAGGDDVDADWQLVSEKDLMSSKLFPDAPTAGQALQQLEPQSPPAKQMPLPTMSEQSSLLPENLRGVIHASLPTLARGRQWVLLYSTLKHGISLRTLYRKAGLIPGPCLLVAGDKLGAIFGGLLLSPLKPTPKKKYQGTSDSFVFTNVAGIPQVFRSTGFNRYFVLCTNDAIAFGGGGHFALHLDSELLYGTSAACETFGNSGLATTEDFVLKNVELWGFAHTSRYVPKHASFKEPEIVRGMYSW